MMISYLFQSISVLETSKANSRDSRWYRDPAKSNSLSQFFCIIVYLQSPRYNCNHDKCNFHLCNSKSGSSLKNTWRVLRKLFIKCNKKFKFVNLLFLYLKLFWTLKCILSCVSINYVSYIINVYFYNWNLLQSTRFYCNHDYCNLHDCNQKFGSS